MLCLKAEAVWGDLYVSHGAILPVNLGSSIQSAMQRGVRQRGERWGYGASDPSSSSSSGDRFSRFEETKTIHGRKVDSGGKMGCYRSQLEEEVQILEKQLQDEIDLHVALANAVGNTVLPLSSSPSKLPNKARELLASIDALEITVRKLEEELFILHFNLQHERSERHAAEIHIEYLQIPSMAPPSSTSGYIWEEHVSSLRVSKLDVQMPPSIHLDLLPGNEDLELASGPAENILINEVLGPCHRREEEKRIIDSSLRLPVFALKDLKVKKLWRHPNQLSEEMVSCMRNIFLRLSRSPTSTSKTSLSKWLTSLSFVAGNLSHSSWTSFSDSSRLPSSAQTSSELIHGYEVMDQEDLYDPYGVNERSNWRDIGKYRLAKEVSWMSVGKAQLEYAASALKKFRFLVEQLAKVNPAQMSNDEKLAFWINLYNALIMHIYLAYGVPKSDIKLFSLMKKACYTVGDQTFSAADIEFVILKMKPPAHRPQIALTLALHKFKLTEEHRQYSIDSLEPLVLFGLSSGMYSCPAVRIFTAANVQEELKNSMKDYIQASVGINDKGKLLVPKLLYFFANGVVEDSLLVDWICRHLTAAQASIIMDSTSHQKQRLLRAPSFSVIPFDSRFRYLFLPHNKNQNC
ncbi:uncharacterized protein LOC110031812 [Phalaenopsis equestris]|uniref:uncharacterized protein LOC110031812 n=1 Tax=Phalaenopsis equestris TaxID=78828 RepID=UPI0009E44931|nr:uncharacterized protein LOC110031812 [Phalaenopsis equestris]